MLCPHFCARCGAWMMRGTLTTPENVSMPALICPPKPFGCGKIERPQTKEETDAETESGSR